ncbi:hypothetical protein J4401_03440 [Candidatus Woesearchaeota archaeon]|nr:hypothetical protein [Candidatus Woesearchaeota archaeon]
MYQTIRDFVLKPVYIVGISAIALTGCEKGMSPAQAPEAEIEKKLNRYSFDDFSMLYVRPDGRNADMKLGDLDGDGDLDIAIIDDTGTLKIYENRIPQKK